MDQTKEANKYSIAGLVLGIISFINLFGMEKAIAAIVFSVLGLVEINKNRDKLKGKALSIAGIIMGCILAVIVLFVLATRPDLLVPKISK